MSALQIKTKIVSCHTADSKPVKQEVNATVILPLLVILVGSIGSFLEGYICSRLYWNAIMSVFKRVYLLESL
jgi:hypothetical protein